MADFVVRVPGEPFAQPRANAAPLMRDGKPVMKNGRPVIVVYDTPGAKNWKATAQGHMLGIRFPSGPLEGCIEGPVALRVLAVFTCPKSHHRKREPLPRRWHVQRPDGDNVLKAVKDAAKGVLWLDDSQVAVAEVTKIIGAQGEAPYVEVRVRELTAESLQTGGDALRDERLTISGDRSIHSTVPSVSNEAPVADEVLPGPEDQPPLFREAES